MRILTALVSDIPGKSAMRWASATA